MVRQSDGLFKISRWIGVVLFNGIRIFFLVLFTLLVLFIVFGMEEEKGRKFFRESWIMWVTFIYLMISIGEAVFGCVSAYTLNYTMMYCYAIVATIWFVVSFPLGIFGSGSFLYDFTFRAAIVISSWVVVCGLRDDPNGGQPVYGQQY